MAVSCTFASMDGIVLVVVRCRRMGCVARSMERESGAAVIVEGYFATQPDTTF